MTTVELQVVEDGAAKIAVSSSCSSGALNEALSPLLRLITTSVDAETTLADFPVDLPNNRQRAAMAVAMKAAYHLEQAQRLFEGVIDLSEGKADAAAFGFPEFQDDFVSES